MKVKTELNDLLRKKFFYLCWITYFSVYLGRINFSAALAKMLLTNIFTKSQGGLIGTAFFLTYGAGQLINGVLSDNFPPFKMIIIGLGFSITSNILISLTSSYLIMILLWGFNGIAQSMLWPAIFNVITNYLPNDFRGKAYIIIASATPFGTLFSYIISIFALKISWQAAFVIPSIIMLIVFGVWIFTAFKYPIEMKYKAKKFKSTSVKKGVSLTKVLIVSGGLTIAFSILFQGMLKDGVNNWVPSILTETFNLTPSFSLLLTMTLPIINLSGVYLVVFLCEKIFKKNEIHTATAVFLLSSCPLAALLLINKLGYFITILLFAIFTTLMTGYNHLMITMVPSRFSRYNIGSTISGAFNSVTYIGAAISSTGFGMISEKFGWSNTILIWLGIVLIGTIFCLKSYKKWGNFINEA